MTAAGLHVAIIMDGNGRWAQARGLPRVAGHRAGGRSVRRVVEAAPTLGISTLTLYAFSSDNWSRPASEVRTLMCMFRRYLVEQRERAIERGVRVSVIGRRDRLAPELLGLIRRVESDTASGRTLHLRLAIDYSARHAIVQAAAALGCESAAAFGPDVDLLIRTSGEKRLSDFLLWECAYAELLFTRVAWPDFDGRQLSDALEQFHGRQRRYGGLPAAPGA